MTPLEIPFKIDDKVIVYGYAHEMNKDKTPRFFGKGEGRHPSYGFFNGVEMQIVEDDTQHGCRVLICREFNLNEGEIRDWMVHAGQVRKAK